MPEAPDSPDTGDQAAELRKRTFTTRGVILQIIGVTAGLALLAWAVSIALSEDNREHLAKLRAPSLGLVAMLLGTSVVSILLNGVVFWIALLPIRRLRALDVIGVNAIATFLSILPLKLGFLLRAFIHVRRDGVRVRELFYWFAGVGAVGMAVILPVGLASLWRRDVDLVWVLIVLTGPPACGALGVLLGRLAMRRAWLARLSLGSWRVVRDARVVGAQVLLRMIDLGVHSARFYAAAGVAGIVMEPSRAVLLGTSYFLLTALAPAGTLGFAEMGTAGVAVLIGSDANTIALVALVVTLSQAAASLMMGLGACTWIKPWRVVMGHRHNA